MQQLVAEESMETAAACEIARLPEELLSAAISRTTPRDACRAAAVSPAFRAAADSDAVWSTFLPRDLPPLADGELSPAPPSKKGMFLCLSDRPVLLPCKRTSMWLDWEKGAKCYMLSARALNIALIDSSCDWRWIPLADSRFKEAAELHRHVFSLEIRGKIDCKMLSQNSTYGAYIVFKLSDFTHGLNFRVQEASVSVGGSKSTRQVCLWYEDDAEVPRRYSPGMPFRVPTILLTPPAIPENTLLPQERADGWMELEMGEFYNEEGDDGEVCVSLMEMTEIKIGLVVQGIEIRPSK